MSSRMIFELLLFMVYGFVFFIGGIAYERARERLKYWKTQKIRMEHNG